MSRKQLSKSQIKSINSQIETYNISLNKKDNIELLDDEIILVNNEPWFFYLDSVPIPTLKLELKKNLLRKVTVDMGAIKFVANGADIMRPGIVDIDPDIKEGDIITIIDINNKKPISISKSLLNSEDLHKADSGKVIKNIHYVGDRIWNTDQ